MLNERIKMVRKALDLTQQEFAERIGMKRNSIALIENGRSTSDQTIFAICREFDVNEEWLRTGVGEMFNPAPRSALDALAKEYNLSPAARVMVEKFARLKPEIQEAIFGYIQEVAAAFQDNTSKPEAPAAPARDLSSLSIDEKVELYRRELEREEKAEGKSEVS